jgi:hypothetical protein
MLIITNTALKLLFLDTVINPLHLSHFLRGLTASHREIAPYKLPIPIDGFLLFVVMGGLKYSTNSFERTFVMRKFGLTRTTSWSSMQMNCVFHIWTTLKFCDVNRIRYAVIRQPFSLSDISSSLAASASVSTIPISLVTW